MKTFKNWLVACVAMILSLGATRVQAAIINYVGTQSDLGSYWRTSSAQKPLDIDNNNVLGTDSYDVINLPTVPLLGNGAVQFGFTNYSDMSFTVLASTNVALPLNLWTSLGIIMETSLGSGQYQFTDPQAPNYTERFYRVQAP